MLKNAIIIYIWLLETRESVFTKSNMIFYTSDLVKLLTASKTTDRTECTLSTEIPTAYFRLKKFFKQLKL